MHMGSKGNTSKRLINVILYRAASEKFYLIHQLYYLNLAFIMGFRYSCLFFHYPSTSTGKASINCHLTRTGQNYFGSSDGDFQVQTPLLWSHPQNLFFCSIKTHHKT